MASKVEFPATAIANPERLLKLLSFNRTDAGNAEALATLEIGRLRYNHSKGKWLWFNGTHWTVDETGEAERAALDSTRQRFMSAMLIPDIDDRQEMADWTLRSESTYAIRAMLTSAQTIRSLSTVAADYDRDPFLFTVGNGTLDLRTGKLRDCRREDLITRATNVNYIPDAQCPRWDTFLQDIFTGDQALIRFVQRAVGYSLTGDTREQCLFILHGGGANGKSTFLETVLMLVGTHGAITPFSTFLVRQNPGSPRNDLASLHGARLVKAAESQKQAALDEAVVKELTGQDSIAVRFLFHEQFVYWPMYKIWLTTNHRPTIYGTDDAIWRRIRMIPFKQQFKGKQRDPQLREKLAAELSGILAWAVRGCMEWQRAGLGEVPAVQAATLDYRRESDHFGRFLSERCTDLARDQASGQELFEAYLQWCITRGERPEANNNFAKALADRGMKKRRTKKGVVYVGVGLRPTVKPLNADKS